MATTNAVTNNTSTESRALALLGSGVPPAQVAAAIGVSEARISQLLSAPEFAAQVAELRFASLQKHNARDGSYDDLEDALLKKMTDCLPFMIRPLEILKAIQIINAAKRRGASAPESITAQQTIVSLTVPVQILNKFQMTAQGQVTHAGDTELVTMQAGTLLREVENDTHAINNKRNSALPALAAAT